jgi:hypothetical protein
VQFFALSFSLSLSSTMSSPIDDDNDNNAFYDTISGNAAEVNDSISSLNATDNIVAGKCINT